MDSVQPLKLFASLALTTLCFVSNGCEGKQVTQSQGGAPNILLIIADDMGLDATPGYPQGSEKPDMPTLQSLQASGLTFDNVWADPLCSPTRATILTGKYGVRTGVTGVTANNAISLSETSLQSYLTQTAGYECAVIGKWHLSDASNGGADNPGLMGVEHYAGLIAGQHDDYYAWQLTRNGETSQVQEYSTSLFTDLALEWLGGQSQPWFLWLAYTAPHTPFHLPPTELHANTSLSGDSLAIDSNPQPYYFAALEAMDTEIGRLLESVDLSNTAVIFIGDNGSPARVAQLPYLRSRAKGTVYQGGIHVPLVVSGAGIARAGEREDALINSTDLFATIAELAGAGLTSIHDSQSFKSLLTGGQMQERSVIYAESEENGSAWTIRDTQYKLIEQDGVQEFYDLLNDPYEADDLLPGGLTGSAVTTKTFLEAAAAEIRN